MKQIRCSVKYFCLSSLLIFVGSILLCSFGFMVILPYKATQHWPRVMCNVTLSGYNMQHCSCDEQTIDYDRCIDAYPCLQIYVSYSAQNKHINTNPATVLTNNLIQLNFTKVSVGHETEQDGRRISKLSANILQEYSPLGNNSHVAILSHLMASVKQSGNSARLDFHAMLYRSWSDVFYNSCSIHECGMAEWNIRESQNFRDSRGIPGHEYPCFYNPERPQVAILETVPYHHMIHAVLWPTLCLVSGTFIWLGMWLGCWKIEMENKYSYPQRPQAVGLDD